MAHAFECPSCSFTNRVTDELFAKKVNGRRVKVTCKGCRIALVVDATTPVLDVALYRTQLERVLPPKPPVRQKEPSVSEGETVIQISSFPSEPPPTSWPQTIPPLASSESQAALLAPSPSRDRSSRVFALALVAVGLLFVGVWAARRDSVAAFSSPDSKGEGEPLSAAQSALIEPAEAPLLSALDTEEASRANEGVTEATAEVSTNTQSVEEDASQRTPEAEETSEASRENAKATEVAAVARSTKDSSHRTSETEETSGAASRANADVSETVAAASAKTLLAKSSSKELEGRDEADAEAQVLPFDKTLAAAALEEVHSEAAACRTPGDPSGVARVAVTFAPSGRVTSATVSGPPFAGTQTGGCIASRFRSARVPRFEGTYVTVTKTVVLQ